jgi:hypothetical protein
MAYAGTIQPPQARIPRLGFQIKVTHEKGTGGGGAPDPEDKRSKLCRLWDGLRNLVRVQVK